MPNFTLEGHDKGVNCVDYFAGGDRPYLISGADDKLVKARARAPGISPYSAPKFAQNLTCGLPA